MHFKNSQFHRLGAISYRRSQVFRQWEACIAIHGKPMVLVYCTQGCRPRKYLGGVLPVFPSTTGFSSQSAHRSSRRSWAFSSACLTFSRLHHSLARMSLKSSNSPGQTSLERRSELTQLNHCIFAAVAIASLNSLFHLSDLTTIWSSTTCFKITFHLHA